MYQFQKRFSESADLLTSVKLSISGQKVGSQSLRSPKPLLYCRGGDSGIQFAGVRGASAKWAFGLAEFFLFGRAMRVRLSGFARRLGEFGPNALPVVGTEIFSSDDPTSCFFDLRATIHRDGARALLPTVDGLRRHAQLPRHVRGPYQIACFFERFIHNSRIKHYFIKRKH
jgi:hypothetical protein